MGSLVGLTTTRRRETLRTITTDVRLLLGVRSHVGQHVAVLSETSAADLATEWFLVGMDTLMSLGFAEQSKGLVTVSASKRLVLHVDRPHVCLHTAGL